MRARASGGPAAAARHTEAARRWGAAWRQGMTTLVPLMLREELKLAAGHSWQDRAARQLSREDAIGAAVLRLEIRSLARGAMSVYLTHTVRILHCLSLG